ncbi:UPF0728 protein C10orf53 homolog [Nyctibius grandis]|uniref:UPF0728 protein C10orf53 homolog n=1 Tax=Nyctibius grandis TaxID=48427 RepID=UPI0035BBB09B
MYNLGRALLHNLIIKRRLFSLKLIAKLKFSYKTQYLGVQAVLQADGHQLILEEIPDWNAVELVVNEETVFRCNIHNLDFGGDGKLDPLCEEARKAVLNAC